MLSRSPTRSPSAAASSSTRMASAGLSSSRNVPRLLAARISGSRQPVLTCEGQRAPVLGDGFTRSAEHAGCPRAGDQQVGDALDVVDDGGQRESLLHPCHRFRGTGAEHLRSTQLPMHLDREVRVAVAEAGAAPPRASPPTSRSGRCGTGRSRGSSSRGRLPGASASARYRSIAVRDLDIGVGPLGRALRRPRDVLVEAGDLGRVGGHRDRLAQVEDRLVRRRQRERALGGAPQGEARLGGDRIRLGPRLTGRVRGKVVAGQDAGQLVVPQRLEVACGGKVP